MVERKRILIMGAAGRDFHNFNVFFRDKREYEVVAFTQAPGQNIGELAKIPKRNYPKELAGKLYPKGIPIYPEKTLPQIIKKEKIDEVVLAYSDLSHVDVMHKASIALASGADFKLMGPETTMLESKRFVISVCAVRTGSGKSPTARKICQLLKSRGIKFVVVRHPMPYGDLNKMIVQRFSTKSDFDKYDSTIEEREEYEPHIESGNIVYAGVDYEKILRQAEREADVIVWDGGNNDLPFIKPNLHIVIADARRPGHELLYYPGETNLRMADVVIVNKIDTANPVDIETVIANVNMINPKAIIIKAAMPGFVDKPELIRGKRVLAIEDGPTLTHGGLNLGAASLIAKNLGAYIISPRDKAVGSIREVYSEYPHLGAVLPAMGYSRKQIDELEQTINSVECDSVLIGTPADLRSLLNINKPAARVRYEIQEIGKPNLEDILNKFLRKV
jgi:predicted GTPase